MALRDKVHDSVERLTDTQLEDVLRYIALLQEASDVEPEEIWLLRSGALKQMVDEIETAPPPVDDWRKHLIIL